MRRTRAEAERTREAIVDAALACFDAHGLARATIDQIAAAAGVTKGAVYHHFSGKDAILHAIRERVSIPLIDRADTALLCEQGGPALARIERFLVGVVETLERDALTRRALRVMQLKCEYVDEMEAELAAALRNHCRLLQGFETAYAQARAAGELDARLAPRMAALETLVFLNGLVRLWLVDSRRKGLRSEAREAIRSHVRLRAAQRRPRGSSSPSRS